MPIFATLTFLCRLARKLLVSPAAIKVVPGQEALEEKKNSLTNRAVSG